MVVVADGCGQACMVHGQACVVERARHGGKGGTQLHVTCEPCMHEGQTGERTLLFAEARPSK